jgi:hypothetical protein
MRKDSSPPMGISLTTYAELETVVGAFAAGNLNLLILLGSHGLGKSRVLRQATVGRARWIEGTASPLGFTASYGGIRTGRSFSTTLTTCTPTVKVFGS